ncbi:unnamed protein product [Sphagnum jensenii]|uniref:Uncharacterized protein n=1 Tax=Sphagnum jensenii TaxID=128206 RepID=A0ABP1B4J1_9BRYO
MPMSRVRIAFGINVVEVQRSSSENDTVTIVTHGHGEQATGLAAADEQPKITDGIDVETPTVEEKYSTVEEDQNGGVNTGGVGNDGRDSTGVGDGGASTGAGDDEEPSFEKATEATSYGEEEKTAIPPPAATADEQPSNRRKLLLLERSQPRPRRRPIVLLLMNPDSMK